MNFSIIQGVLDGILNRPGRPPQVEFHGGEPLLAFDRIMQTVEYVNLLGVSDIRLFLQTNGTLLTDEVVSFIAEHGIDVGISLDGPEWINNQHRVFRDGSGSFQTVMQGIDRLRAHQIDFKINCVVVDPSQLLEAFFFFQKAGFRKIKFSLLAPMGRAHNNRDLAQYGEAFASEHLKAFRQALALWKIRGDRIELFNISCLLRNLIWPERYYMCMRSPCGIGSAIVCIGEGGEIFPCEELYGLDEFRVGYVQQQPNWVQALHESSIVRALRKRTVESIPSCQTCPWALYCCGGCTSRSIRAFGSLFREDVHCIYYQRMFAGLSQILKSETVLVLSYLADIPYREFLREISKMGMDLKFLVSQSGSNER
jgi:uncharacterized protein